MSNTSAVPSFIIKIDGTRLPPDREADVKEILIFEKTDAPSRFELTLNNEGFRWTDTDDIAVGSELNISIGYKDALEEMMVGDITGIRANMRFGQANTVTYIGHSKSHVLLRGRKSQAFTEMTVTEIIEQIASDAGMTSDVEQITEKRMFTLQKDMSDFNYLMSLAERYGCTITDFDGELCFKRQVANSGEDLVLEYNKTLVEFYPSTDVNFLVTEVEVRGWDRAQHQSVRGTKTHSDAGSDGGGLVEESFGAAQHALLDIRVKDQNEADQLALDYLTQNARKYIQGYGIAVGNTDLRAGGIVKVEGIADRYKGKYYVWAVQHRLEIGVGYTSKFFIGSNVATQGNASNTTGSSGPGQGGDSSSSGSTQQSGSTPGTASSGSSERAQPSITNLKWKLDGIDVSNGLVGDIVTLTADVSNIADGTPVKIKIFEKDKDNDDDMLFRKMTGIENGKVELNWRVKYTDDFDDVDSQDELEERGYTLPEYIFYIEESGNDILSESSPVLNVKGWFRKRLIDVDSRKVLKNTDYILHLPDGSTEEGTTDEEGYFEHSDLDIGKYHISLKSEDEEEAENE